MMQNHPRLASLSCDDCKKYATKIPDGEIETYEIDGRQEPVPRAPGVPTPCDKCPKGSPEEEHLHVLADQNYVMLAFHRQWKSARRNGLNFALPEKLRNCPVLLENLTIVDEMMDAQEQQISAMRLAQFLLPMMRG